VPTFSGAIADRSGIEGIAIREGVLGENPGNSQQRLRSRKLTLDDRLPPSVRDIRVDEGSKL